LFVDVDNSMRIAREEIFGPVLVVIPFDDDDDAIRIANDSIYGLAGGVHSSNVARGEAVARRIRTGSISVNGAGSYRCDMPFGGFKQSGIGRQWGTEGFDEMMELTSLSTPA
jgi:aldehyde dehydrogenase (NAD+)